MPTEETTTGDEALLGRTGHLEILDAPALLDEVEEGGKVIARAGSSRCATPKARSSARSWCCTT